jgi:hypothetical protein
MIKKLFLILIKKDQKKNKISFKKLNIINLKYKRK